MAGILETLAQGLVSARPDTTLSEGELTQAEECYYEPAEGAPYPVPGRKGIIQGALPEPVVGIQYARRNQGDLIVAHAGDKFYFQPVAETPQVAVELINSGGATGDHFDLVQQDDYTALLNGPTNTMFGDTGTVRPLGFQPTALAPTYNWPGAMAAPVRWFEFWYTEYDSVTGIESGATLTAIVQERAAGGTFYAPTIATLANPTANRWRLYISPPLINPPGAATPYPVFPTGFLYNDYPVGFDMPIDTANIDWHLAEAVPYPGISITGIEGEDEVRFQANDVPPQPDTGCLFENSLVCNDINQPWLVRWPIAGTMWSWPLPYRLNPSRSTAEKILRIVRVGKSVLVFGSGSISRIDGLPRENDPTFTPEEAWAVVSESHILIGRKALCHLTLDDDPLVAFMTRNGLFVTDGNYVKPLEYDIRWRDLISASRRKNVVLVNDSDNHIIRVHYTPQGGNRNTKALFFHYHQTHRKANGTLKATGPVTVEAEAAVHCDSEALLEPALIEARKNGTIWLEGRGSPELPMKLATRRITHATPRDEKGQEWMWLHHQGESGSSAKMTIESMGEGGKLESFSKTINFERPGFAAVSGKARVQNYRFLIETTVPIDYWQQEIE